MPYQWLWPTPWLLVSLCARHGKRHICQTSFMSNVVPCHVCHQVHGELYVRISAASYNELDDYRSLAQAVLRMLT
jgi:hypothetical protein